MTTNHHALTEKLARALEPRGTFAADVQAMLDAAALLVREAAHVSGQWNTRRSMPFRATCSKVLAAIRDAGEERRVMFGEPAVSEGATAAAVDAIRRNAQTAAVEKTPPEPAKRRPRRRRTDPMAKTEQETRDDAALLDPGPRARSVSDELGAEFARTRKTRNS